MARKRKGRTSPPMKCGNAFEMRCMVADWQGKTFDCVVYPRLEKKSCATANIDIMKGKILFYDLP